MKPLQRLAVCTHLVGRPIFRVCVLAPQAAKVETAWSEELETGEQTVRGGRKDKLGQQDYIRSNEGEFRQNEIEWRKNGKARHLLEYG